MSGAEIERNMVVIDLDAPRELVLFSSYPEWMNYTETVMFGRELRDVDSARRMFNTPTDSRLDNDEWIQCVIPYIEPSWIRSISEVLGEFRE
jgi:hypothetical protein